MGRRKKIIYRRTSIDPKHQDVVVSKFINQLMSKGKKSVAESIFYKSLEALRDKNLGKEPIEIFKRALENVKPFVEVRSRRVGGATYQVPVEVRPDRRQTLAIRWMLQYAWSRRGHSMIEKLTQEIIDAFGGTGGAIKKKEDMHRMAEANKAFAHYRW